MYSIALHILCYKYEKKPWFRAVEALMINNFGYTIPESKAADTRIYMDDRTFVDSDLHRALDRVMAWNLELVSRAA